MLEPEDCQELLREGVQYYHRYLSFWHLGLYELCARDTERNLRLFAFVREHARDDRIRLEFDQWRPYVTMMHARAVATPLVELEQWEAAVNVLDAGIRGIEQFLDDYNQKEKAPQVGELTFLQRWKQEILEKNPPRALTGPDAATEPTVAAPPDPITQVRDDLAKAITKSATKTRPACATTSAGWRIRRRRRCPAWAVRSAIVASGRAADNWNSPHIAVLHVSRILTTRHRIAAKRDRLLALIASYGSCAVAYSGGVDSAVVAKAAQLALGDAAVAVTGVSASLAEGELDDGRGARPRDRHSPRTARHRRARESRLRGQRTRSLLPLQDGALHAARRARRAAGRQGDRQRHQCRRPGRLSARPRGGRRRMASASRSPNAESPKPKSGRSPRALESARRRQAGLALPCRAASPTARPSRPSGCE